ncbi:MAG: hybrid sensor histidine kinase/response regulator [Leptolyngbya sp.]|nr:MAG: hybrid sensor histidine kinase/response regulator [Leptolyngbya sp.]
MVKAKVLIVEDEILVAREIEGCLQELGYGVTGIAADAEVALQQIAETQPDLALIDIVIQGEQDGVTLASQVRDRYQIPIIYLTAYVDEQTLSRAKLTRPLGYILKPFNKNDLRVAIEIALARHQIELEEKSAILALVERYPNETMQPNTDDITSQSFEYLSILSHELRNPISAIQLATTMLKDHSDQIDEAKKQQLLHRIQAATSSMNQLIEDVLTLGHTEHHATPFHPEVTDVVEFCQMLLEPFQWDRGKQHTINFTYQPASIHACIDKRLLWYAVSNLLGNAIKYSPDKATVTLRVSSTNEEICFEVQDQGIGIPPDDLEHLFKPFHRGSNVGKLPGTGLGLAIVKRIVELHDGIIDVESQAGCGTTFSMKLPL